MPHSGMIRPYFQILGLLKKCQETNNLTYVATYVRLVYIGDVFYGDIAGDSDTRQALLTCLGHLGQSDRDRNDPNCQGK